ncbi:MAG: anti-sigma F factor [Acetivibrionales bacterium]|jgi:stage II sporulation protein AB (anti-sigma F factor)|nr:anti-sigma F factor [Clostridiaceae bacterium]
MQPVNKMKTEFISKSVNEGFARVVAASFVAQADPSIDILADIRTAVSEAVTNAIIHGYEEKDGIITMECILYSDHVSITIEDFGKGIDDIEKAKAPLYTSRPELERSGMGFTVMETFMDSLEVESVPGKGTKIHMTKQLEYR